MEPNKLSKEALSAYLYDVSTLELARKNLDEKCAHPKAVLAHNDAVMQNFTKPEPPVYLTQLEDKDRLSISTIIVGGLFWGIVSGAITGIIAYLISFPLSWFFFPSLSHVRFTIGSVIIVLLIFTALLVYLKNFGLSEKG